MSQHRQPAPFAAHRAAPPPARRLSNRSTGLLLLISLVLFWLIVLGVVIF